MIDTLNTAWSWTGLIPAKVIHVNPFGNLVIKATDATYWRICPELLTCGKVADDDAAFSKVWSSQEFQFDWGMAKLVSVAKSKLGQPEDGHCYCLKLSPVLGGTYDENNIGSISLKELLAFSGSLARQIKDIPDGHEVKIKIERIG